MVCARSQLKSQILPPSQLSCAKRVDVLLLITTNFYGGLSNVHLSQFPSPLLNLLQSLQTYHTTYLRSLPPPQSACPQILAPWLQNTLQTASLFLPNRSQSRLHIRNLFLFHFCLAHSIRWSAKMELWLSQCMSILEECKFYTLYWI